WDAWEEYRSNVNAPLASGDIRDFSHIAAIPYVTHLTMDAKWQDMCERALKRRLKEGLRAPFFNRIFPNLDAVLASLDANTASRFGKMRDRKSTRLNSSHVKISYAVFCLKKK